MSDEHRPVAVVTGGLRGIGRAILDELQARGFCGACVDLVEPDLAEAETPLPEGFRYYRLDISLVEEHQEVVDRIVADFGGIDTLVNNAGIAVRPPTDILDVQPADFDRSLNVNLRGTFFLSQAVARSMVASASTHYRSIVNIASMAAHIAAYDRAQYAIGKAAVSKMTQLYAARLAVDGIHVHEVRPGFIRTPMTAAAAPRIEEIVRDAVPMRRWGTPQDVARTVATLATGGLPYTTGESIWVAGGVTIPQVR
ncbi:3-ketoacyl-ACP reductase [Microbacterium betulae]|uniref:3-ketoacyl-ACP reductase n=1 Tax=Microbacterium betulae TaxID=2981139 RepID=A0AA97FGN1_9MICO|nr:3-ketoacyl-ACP reductase [Microbacterium sp. AB]WOF22838.1 3-ketoacyl-ACP reductase [Microbacterium sp. AB]